MMSIALGAIVVTRAGRTIPIQRWTDNEYYAALRAFGARESVAAAAAAGLITVKTGSN